MTPLELEICRDEGCLVSTNLENDFYELVVRISSIFSTKG